MGRSYVIYVDTTLSEVMQLSSQGRGHLAGIVEEVLKKHGAEISSAAFLGRFDTIFRLKGRAKRQNRIASAISKEVSTRLYQELPTPLGRINWPTTVKIAW